MGFNRRKGFIFDGRVVFRRSLAGGEGGGGNASEVVRNAPPSALRDFTLCRLFLDVLFRVGFFFWYGEATNEIECCV